MKANTKAKAKKTKEPSEADKRIERYSRLQEMAEDMAEGIANARKVADQQKKLVEVLEANAAEDFKDFIETTKNSLAEIDRQADELGKRASLLKIVISDCESDEKIKYDILLLIEALGLFR